MDYLFQKQKTYGSLASGAFIQSCPEGIQRGNCTYCAADTDTCQRAYWYSPDTSKHTSKSKIIGLTCQANLFWSLEDNQLMPASSIWWSSAKNLHYFERQERAEVETVCFLLHSPVHDVFLKLSRQDREEIGGNNMPHQVGEGVCVAGLSERN